MYKAAFLVGSLVATAVLFTAGAVHAARVVRVPVWSASAGGELFAGGPNTNIVDAYPPRAKNPPPSRQITNGLFAPTGMAVDSAGNLYVCNNAGHSIPTPGKGFWTVTVYRPNGSIPFRTYTAGVWSPVDVAVATDGTAYIANFGSGS